MNKTIPITGCTNHATSCNCFIIPSKVLRRFSKDKKLSDKERKAFSDALKFEQQWRDVRAAKASLLLSAKLILPAAVGKTPSGPTHVSVFNSQHGSSLPGSLIPKAGSSSNAVAKKVFGETTSVAKFYQTLFGRKSIDDAGMALISSIHFSVNYNNAFWNGSQMVYGDGDGKIFLNFAKANDVIGHELTHGVTEHSLGLAYKSQAGGLNESISDVFGSMFRQWEANQDVTKADWLIGKDIMGPAAIDRGYTCLRDMANPSAKHCLAPQPTEFSQYHDGMDPHESSGIPARAGKKPARSGTKP
jgi:Zn-dependent metalloprotease